VLCCVACEKTGQSNGPLREPTNACVSLSNELPWQHTHLRERRCVVLKASQKLMDRTFRSLFFLVTANRIMSFEKENSPPRLQRERRGCFQQETTADRSSVRTSILDREDSSSKDDDALDSNSFHATFLQKASRLGLPTVKRQSQWEQALCNYSTGTWTRDERLLFLKGLRAYGWGRWKEISGTYLVTRYVRVNVKETEIVVRKVNSLSLSSSRLISRRAMISIIQSHFSCFVCTTNQITINRSSKQIKCHGQKTKQKIQRGKNILEELLVAEATGTAPSTPNHIVERRQPLRMDGPSSPSVELALAWNSSSPVKDSSSVDYSETGQRQEEPESMRIEEDRSRSSSSLALILRASDEEMTAADTLCRLQVAGKIADETRA
jgi:hypothetical protein